MILADTSIWIDHLRSPDAALLGLIRLRLVAMHPYVAAEIALGSIARRDETLRAIDELLPMPVATVGEVRALVERRRLHARGVGFVDASLVASCLLRVPSRLWTRDRRLETVARDCGVECYVGAGTG